MRQHDETPELLLCCVWIGTLKDVLSVPRLINY